MNDYSKYIAKSRYAKWNEKEKRRETFEETVDRICSFWVKRVNESSLSEEEKEKIIKEIG